MISFGTGGWRAEIGKDFYMSNIRLVAQALANCILQDGQLDRPVVFGFDRRFLSLAGRTEWTAGGDGLQTSK
jgi:phosphomannomutase